MYTNVHPRVPRYNPSMEEGIYQATIHEVENNTYGEDKSPMVRIVLGIPSKRVYFATHIYFPNNYSLGAQRRLWHLCRSVALDMADVDENPDAFEGRWLRIKVVECTSESYAPYCDVQAFYPSEPELEEPEDTEGWGMHCDWIKPLGV